MTRWGMVIDLDRCTACGACVVACRAENNVPFAGEEQAALGRAIFWMRLMPIDEDGGEPRFIPLLCQHCDEPPCVRVCPVGATYKNEEGLNAQIYARCIGCRLCAVACPYTVRNFNWLEPRWPETMKAQLNPDVSVRPKGVIEKCSFCAQRIRQAKDRAKDAGQPLKDGDVVPACAQSCPADAMHFGDLDDPESLVSRLARSPRAFRLMEDLGTRPKVIYLAGWKWDEHEHP